MWVSPAVRGLGLGRRLLDELEAQAARHGARLLRLETNRNLTEAIAMYRVGRLRRGGRVQRRGLRPPLVRKAAPGAMTFAAGGAHTLKTGHPRVAPPDQRGEGELGSG